MTRGKAPPVLNQPQPRPRLWKNCVKHGKQFALPVIDGVLGGRDFQEFSDWPADVEDEQKYPRVCVKCLAASMIQPIRKSRAA